MAFNEREREIIKVALLYFNANRDDVAEVFAVASNEDIWSVGGQEIPSIFESEIQEVLKNFQDIL